MLYPLSYAGSFRATQILPLSTVVAKYLFVKKILLSFEVFLQQRLDIHRRMSFQDGKEILCRRQPVCFLSGVVLQEGKESFIAHCLAQRFQELRSPQVNCVPVGQKTVVIID